MIESSVSKSCSDSTVVKKVSLEEETSLEEKPNSSWDSCYAKTVEFKYCEPSLCDTEFIGAAPELSLRNTKIRRETSEPSLTDTDIIGETPETNLRDTDIILEATPEQSLRDTEIITSEPNSRDTESAERINEQSTCYTEFLNMNHGTEFDSFHLVQLAEKVRLSSLPNYKGCRIPLPCNKMNIPLWRKLLTDYEDNVICEFLEYGFPLDFDTSVTLNTNERRNHKGAKDHPEFVNQYLNKEIMKSRIIGPFPSNPFSVPIMVSPLNTVPKSSTDERRVIVDLSWPIGRGSVNSGISKEFYLEQKVEAHYASVEQVCQMVIQLGAGSLIYKRDLRQAYRQFRIDPGDYHLLGYFWEGNYYADTVLCMGQRNAGYGCSRVTNAVMYVHAKRGYAGVSYLDDLIGVECPERGEEAYVALGELLYNLGLEENYPKACPPSTRQIVLGVIIDTISMTISITEERLAEISSLVTKWRRKKSCKKKELLSLIGKLCCVCKCVQQSRIFLNRLLELVRTVDWKSDTSIKLSDNFHKDLNWWNKFMKTFNGVAFIPSPIWIEPDVYMATDSCLQGCGGICGEQYFHTEFPNVIRDRHSSFWLCWSGRGSGVICSKG